MPKQLAKEEYCLTFDDIKKGKEVERLNDLG